MKETIRIIFSHPENFCGFLYYFFVTIGVVVVLGLFIVDLISSIVTKIKKLLGGADEQER